MTRSTTLPECVVDCRGISTLRTCRTPAEHSSGFWAILPHVYFSCLHLPPPYLIVYLARFVYVTVQHRTRWLGAGVKDQQGSVDCRVLSSTPTVNFCLESAVFFGHCYPYRTILYGAMLSRDQAAGRYAAFEQGKTNLRGRYFLDSSRRQSCTEACDDTLETRLDLVLFEASAPRFPQKAYEESLQRL